MKFIKYHLSIYIYNTTKLLKFIKTTDNQKKTVGKVAAKSSAADGLRSLFIDQLKDVVYAEKSISKGVT